MVDFQWRDFLEIGVDFIDEDHKHLLDIMHDVKKSIEAKNIPKSSALLNELIKETQSHFSREEEFLHKTGYPGLQTHKDFHDELLVEMDKIKVICESVKTEDDLQECFDRMAEFLIDEILSGDTKFKSYLEYEGYIENK